MAKAPRCKKVRSGKAVEPVAEIDVEKKWQLGEVKGAVQLESSEVLSMFV